MNINANISLREQDWVDNLTDGNKTKIIASLPIVSTVILAVKQNRLNKILDDANISKEKKIENLQNMKKFTSTTKKWARIQLLTGIVLAVATLGLFTLATQIHFVSADQSIDSKFAKFRFEAILEINAEVSKYNQIIIEKKAKLRVDLEAKWAAEGTGEDEKKIQLAAYKKEIEELNAQIKDYALAQ